jgi:uncharacterized phage-associated protein
MVHAAVPAAAVAQALRDRLSGLPIKKLHKLLYYCQGHHLAVFGVPLFAESISAWDMGPVVGQLWYSEHQGGRAGGEADPGLDEAQLNTVGYVVSRYGALTGRDLEHLTHSESPWQTADAGRARGQSARIEPEWLVEYFRSDRDEFEDLEVALDTETVGKWLHDAVDRRQGPSRPDSRDELLRRLSRIA